MNKERIQYAISIMEQAQNLNMSRWQTGAEISWTDYVTTIEDLHTCGNTACFAGYIAISPLFHSVGGGVQEWSGAPLMNGKCGEDAILDFFELPSYMQPFMCALVYGGVGTLEIGVPVGDREKDSYQYLERLVERINELVGYTGGSHFEPKHVIAILKALLEGEFDWLEGYTEEIEGKFG